MQCIKTGSHSRFHFYATVDEQVFMLYWKLCIGYNTDLFYQLLITDVKVTTNSDSFFTKFINLVTFAGNKKIVMLKLNKMNVFFNSAFLTVIQNFLVGNIQV